MYKKINYYSENLDFIINEKNYMLKKIEWDKNHCFYTGGFKQYIFVKDNIELSIELKDLYTKCLKLDTKFNKYLLELELDTKFNKYLLELEKEANQEDQAKQEEKNQCLKQ